MARHTIPKLHLHPAEVRVDERVEITVSGCRPRERVTLTAWMTDEYANLWRSHAVFEADAEGHINAAHQTPIEGTYDIADESGLLWSMKKVDQASGDSQTPGDGVETPHSNSPSSNAPDRSPFAVDFTLKTERGEQSKRLHRTVRDPDVDVKKVRHPVHGVLFYRPEGPPRPAVVLIGGSNGTIDVAAAGLLASRGYTTLALAYFNREGLPDRLMEVPLEYFHAAIRWLTEQPFVSKKGLALRGVSRGAEVALLIASRYDGIDAVVAYAPSTVVRAGFGRDGRMGRSAWVHHGKPIPYAAQLLSGPIKKASASTAADSATKDLFLSGVFCWAIQWPEQFSQALIPLEEFGGAVCFVSGTDDQVWPSTVFAEAGVGRLAQRTCDARVEHCVCDGAGHSIRVPNLPVAPPAIEHLSGGEISLGGTGVANARAAGEAWKASCSFLNDTIGG